MKINKIKIQNYGPIHDLAIEPMEFELIFGFNESGKTALVEAIINTLFKRTKLRYSKPESIRIEIVDNSERKHVFPQKKNISQLPAGNLASLLYVKASDSSLHQDRGETAFWDSITDMMNSDGRRMPIAKLIEKIFANVCITLKKGEWQEDKERLIENDRQRKKDISEYIRHIGNIENQEKEMAALIENRKKFKSMLDEIEHYKKFLLFRQVSSLYDEYNRVKTGLQDFERYKYDYQSEWQKLNIEKQSIQKTTAKVKEIEAELIIIKNEIDGLEDRQEKIDAAGFRSLRISDKAPVIPYRLLSLCAFSAAVLIFIVSIFLPPMRSLGIMLAAVGLIISGFFLYKQKCHVKSRSVDEKLLENARQVFPDLKTVKDIPSRIKDIDDELKITTTRYQEKNRSKDNLDQGGNLNEIELKIKNLRDKTGLAELFDLEIKLKEKRVLDDKLFRLRAQLEEKLYEKDELLWPARIKNHEVRLVDNEPDLAVEPQLKKALENANKQIEKLEHDIKLFHEIAKKQHDISNHRQAFLEYEQIQKRLDNYEMEKTAAIKIKEILTEISAEMEDFIADIFNGPNSLSDLFYFITEKYNRIHLENKKFIAYDINNRSYDIDALSSGARDQLLLCFRLAAIKKIYPDGCFLILDDAFIFADWPRRQRLAELLVKFSRQGMQIIYLTSDDHTRDLLVKMGAHLTNI